MTRHTLRLDPTTGTAYCTECGAEFRPPLDPGVLMREECRKDAPASEWLGVTPHRDEEDKLAAGIKAARGGEPPPLPFKGYA